MSESRTNGNGESVIGGIAGFGQDLSRLAELQVKLTLHDFREATARAAVPLTLVLVGAAVIVGGVPVALAGIALLIAASANLALGWSLLITAAVAAAVAGAVVFLSARALPKSFEAFRRSRDELERNIAWIRTVLVYSGRARSRR